MPKHSPRALPARGQDGRRVEWEYVAYLRTFPIVTTYRALLFIFLGVFLNNVVVDTIDKKTSLWFDLNEHNINSTGTIVNTLKKHFLLLGLRRRTSPNFVFSFFQRVERFDETHFEFHLSS